MNWGLVLFLWVAGLPFIMNAQVQVFPRNGIRPQFFYFNQPSIHVYDRTGWNQSFKGTRIGGWGVGMNYQYSVSPKTKLGLGMNLYRLAFIHAWDLKLPESIGFTDRQEGLWVQPAFRFSKVAIELLVEHDLFSYRTFTFGMVVGMDIAFVSFQERAESYFVSDSNSRHLVAVLQYGVNPNEQVLPYFNCGFVIKRRLLNMNELVIGPFLRYSSQGDILTGHYVLYPQKPIESNGRFQSGLTFIGIRSAYTLTWGYPKLPKHLRPSEEQ